MSSNRSNGFLGRVGSGIVILLAILGMVVVMTSALIGWAYKWPVVREVILTYLITPVPATAIPAIPATPLATSTPTPTAILSATSTSTPTPTVTTTPTPKPIRKPATPLPLQPTAQPTDESINEGIIGCQCSRSDGEMGVTEIWCKLTLRSEPGEVSLSWSGCNYTGLREQEDVLFGFYQCPIEDEGMLVTDIFYKEVPWGTMSFPWNCSQSSGQATPDPWKGPTPTP